VTSAELEPLQFYDALTQPPLELFWPRATGEATVNMQPAQRRFNAYCNTTGFLGLGKMEVPNYKIRVKLYQAPWVGRVGVFFGYQQAVYQGRPAWKCHLIQIMTDGVLPKKGTFKLERSVCYLVPGTKLGTAIVPDGITTKNILDPLEREYIMELDVVQPRGLVSVVFGSQDHQELLKTGNNNFKPEDFLGEFGIYLSRSSCWVREPSFMLLEGSNP
jgi:hypothetical protein